MRNKKRTTKTKTFKEEILSLHDLITSCNIEYPTIYPDNDIRHYDEAVDICVIVDYKTERFPNSYVSFDGETEEELLLKIKEYFSKIHWEVYN
jgi:hypothetical protein